MKKIIIFTFFLALCNFIFAQNNLQFSRVLTYSGNSNNGGVIDTVPQGKIWKIEAMGVIKHPFYLTINGSKYSNTIDLNQVGSMSSVGNDKIWLKAGDVIGFISTCWYCGVADYFLSILEFYVTPTQ